MRKAQTEKRNGAMGAEGCRRFIIDFFHAHAIKGAIKPGRTYRVTSTSSAQLKIRSCTHDGRRVQTLFADLMTCKSLKYGEFRRVDLFWGMERKEQETVQPSRSESTGAFDTHVIKSLPSNEFYPNGEPVPVDAFIARSLDGRLSGPFRKEKAS